MAISASVQCRGAAFDAGAAALAVRTVFDVGLHLPAARHDEDVAPSAAAQADRMTAADGTTAGARVSELYVLNQSPEPIERRRLERRLVAFCRHQLSLREGHVGSLRTRCSHCRSGSEGFDERRSKNAQSGRLSGNSSAHQAEVAVVAVVDADRAAGAGLTVAAEFVHRASALRAMHELEDQAVGDRRDADGKCQPAGNCVEPVVAWWRGQQGLSGGHGGVLEHIGVRVATAMRLAQFFCSPGARVSAK